MVYTVDLTLYLILLKDTLHLITPQKRLNREVYSLHGLNGAKFITAKFMGGFGGWSI
jgi:hypothetical protein